MITRQVPGVDKKISPIFFGTASKPFLQGEILDQLLDEVFALGINAIDTARDYGNSEKSIGHWLKERQCRDQIFLLSKCAHPDPLTGRDRLNEKDIREDFNISSGLLNTDYLDLYLMHRDDPGVPVGEIVEIFNALIREKKILSYGGSNWSVKRIREANEYATEHGLIPMSASSPNYSLGRQVKNPWIGNCECIEGPDHKKDREWYIETQLPVISYSSLGRCMFSGKVKSQDPKTAEKYLDCFAQKGFAYPIYFERLRRCEELAQQKSVSVSQIAMAWCYHTDMNFFAIVGSTSALKMKENLNALKISLSEEEYTWLSYESHCYFD